MTWIGTILPFACESGCRGAARRTGHSLRLQNLDTSELTVCGTKKTLEHAQPMAAFQVLATRKRVFMRDCDSWRCENGKILEKWCMLDIPHVLLQLVYDLFAEVRQTVSDQR